MPRGLFALSKRYATSQAPRISRRRRGPFRRRAHGRTIDGRAQPRIPPRPNRTECRKAIRPPACEGRATARRCQSAAVPRRICRIAPRTGRSQPSPRPPHAAGRSGMRRCGDAGACGRGTFASRAGRCCGGHRAGAQRGALGRIGLRPKARPQKAASGKEAARRRKAACGPITIGHGAATRREMPPRRGQQAHQARWRQPQGPQRVRPDTPAGSPQAIRFAAITADEDCEPPRLRQSLPQHAQRVLREANQPRCGTAGRTGRRRHRAAWSRHAQRRGKIRAALRRRSAACADGMRRNCRSSARGRCGAASCPGKFDGPCRADLWPGQGCDAGGGSAVRLGRLADRPGAIRRSGRICADAVAGAQPTFAPDGKGMRRQGCASQS